MADIRPPQDQGRSYVVPPFSLVRGLPCRASLGCHYVAAVAHDGTPAQMARSAGERGAHEHDLHGYDHAATAIGASPWNASSMRDWFTR